jgi:hypothetical protein
VFHVHKGESPREEISEQPIELVLLTLFARPFGDADPANRRVARPRDPEPGGDRSKHPPGLGIGQVELVENAQCTDKSRMHRRMEGHGTRVHDKGLCVWNTKPENCFD